MMTDIPATFPCNEVPGMHTNQYTGKDSVQAFLCEMREKIELENNKGIESSKRILGQKQGDTDYLPRSSCMPFKDVGGAGSSNNGVNDLEDEESFDKMEEIRRKELLKIVSDAPPRKIYIPHFEVPVIPDQDTTITTDVFHSIIKNLPVMNTDTAQLGLHSFVDGSARKELDQLLADIEPRPIAKRRRSVTFADQK
jgi:hypothetical protein